MKVKLTEVFLFRESDDENQMGDFSFGEVDPSDVPDAEGLFKLIGPGAKEAFAAGELVVKQSGHGKADGQVVGGVVYAEPAWDRHVPFKYENGKWQSTNWYPKDLLGKGWQQLKKHSEEKSSGYNSRFGDDTPSPFGTSGKRQKN